MAAISFINPKGGSGKTTLSMMLALEFARRGAKVAVIDADPNAIIHGWAATRSKRGQGIPFHIEQCLDDTRIAKSAQNLSQEYDFVLIDLEGTASKMSSRAMQRSHLVLIPLNASSIDANLAAKAIATVDEESDALDRTIPFRLVRSRDAAAVETRSLRRIKAALKENDVPCLEHGLVERAAYRDVFEFSKTLDELDPSETSNIPGAIANIETVADEVIRTLKDIAGVTGNE